MDPHIARALETISGGRVTVVNDAGTVQKFQISGSPGPSGASTITDEVPRIAEYGFASSPPIGSEVVTVRLWGNRTLCLCIATNHQPSRPTGLTTGDSRLYSARGQTVWLADGQTVHDGGGLPIAFRNYGETATFDNGLSTAGPLAAGNGWTGTFLTGDGRTATVLKGIVTAVA